MHRNDYNDIPIIRNGSIVHIHETKNGYKSMFTLWRIN